MSEYAARSCAGKKRYDSERKATERARTTQKRTGVPMKPYPCKFCKGFHVGSVQVHGDDWARTPRKKRNEKYTQGRTRRDGD